MANGGDKTDPHASPPLRARVQVQQLDLLLRQLDSLPALPAEAARLLEIWRGEGVEPREVAGAVEADGALAQRLISLARARAGEREIDDVAGAIDVLGAEAIRSAVPAMKVFEALSDFAGGPNGREFWTHCIATAAAAELAAERSPNPTDPALAFLCGFLHDIGKLALVECLPKSYGRVLAALSDGAADAAEVEREIIGIDHTVLGRRLGQRWGLPRPAQEAIWLHHQSPQAVPRDLAGAAIAGIVRFADALARQRGYGLAPSGAGPSVAELAEQIGLSGEDLQDVCDRLPGRLAARAELVGLAGTEADVPGASPPPPDEAIEPDGQLKSELAGLRRRLGALERLAELTGRVAPTTQLPQLCLEVARTASAAAGIAAAPHRPVCAFALLGEGEQVILACHDGGEEGSFRFADVRGPQAPPAPGLCPAGGLLAGILHPAEAWSDLLDLDNCTCLPLLCQGRWVGGVLLPAGLAPDAFDDELFAALAPVLGFVLAAAADQARANNLAEQLARASQELSDNQRALAQAEALATVGEMAAGAAHEMNNPLAVIAGRAQLLAGRATTKKDREAAELIAHKAQEISGIATELMEFARPVPPKAQAVEVGRLLSQAKEDILAETDPKTGGVSVDIELRPGCPDVWADPGQVRTILRELLRNAAAAGEQAAAIRLAASPLPPRAGRSGHGRVLISVVDDGGGMDQATAAAAFTPFFSHQAAGRARGMGLARARRYVEANAGKIWIESRPGEGTTVFVALPRAGEEISGGEGKGD